MSTGPSAGVGRGGGGRGGVWHHPAPGARRTGLRHGGAPDSLHLHPVPHSEGAQAEGRHFGAAGHPPAGPRAPGARLCPGLPVHLQSLHLHRHPHRAAVTEVRHGSPLQKPSV